MTTKRCDAVDGVAPSLFKGFGFEPWIWKNLWKGAFLPYEPYPVQIQINRVLIWVSNTEWKEKKEYDCGIWNHLGLVFLSDLNLLIMTF